MKYLALVLDLLRRTNGTKTYLAAAGMAALAAYYILHGDDPTYGVKLLLEALAIFGIGAKIEKTPAETVKKMDEVPTILPVLADGKNEPVVEWKE